MGTFGGIRKDKLEDWGEDFLSRKAGTVSQHTLDTYRSALAQAFLFARWADQGGNFAVNYQDHLAAEFKPRTVTLYTKVLRQFAAYLRTRAYMQTLWGTNGTGTDTLEMDTTAWALAGVEWVVHTDRVIKAAERLQFWAWMQYRKHFRPVPLAQGAEWLGINRDVALIALAGLPPGLKLKELARLGWEDLEDHNGDMGIPNRLNMWTLSKVQDEQGNDVTIALPLLARGALQNLGQAGDMGITGETGVFLTYEGTRGTARGYNALYRDFNRLLRDVAREPSLTYGELREHWAMVQLPGHLPTGHWQDNWWVSALLLRREELKDMGYRGPVTRE